MIVLFLLESSAFIPPESPSTHCDLMPSLFLSCSRIPERGITGLSKDKFLADSLGFFWDPCRLESNIVIEQDDLPSIKRPLKCTYGNSSMEAQKGNERVSAPEGCQNYGL